jgi:excisionase family DNA binding protein
VLGIEVIIFRRDTMATTWQSPEEFMVGKPLKRGAFYRALAEGKIPHVRIGRKILLKSDILDSMQEEKYGSRVGDAQE